jgi:hypothetical protein
LEHPRNAPRWTYSDQDDNTFETDYDDDQSDHQIEEEVVTGKSIPIQLSNDERRLLIDVEEEHERGESSAHGEIRGAILQDEPNLLQRRKESDEEDYDYDGYLE